MKFREFVEVGLFFLMLISYLSLYVCAFFFRNYFPHSVYFMMLVYSLYMVYVLFFYYSSAERLFLVLAFLFFILMLVTDFRSFVSGEVIVSHNASHTDNVGYNDFFTLTPIVLEYEVVKFDVQGVFTFWFVVNVLLFCAYISSCELI